MADRKRSGRKVRVDFRRNRTGRRRSDEWTRRYRAGDAELADEQRGESVRAKGDLSRRRTVIVDDDELPVCNESDQQVGLIHKVHGQLCYVFDQQMNVWECSVRRVLRTVLIEQRGSVTVGDQVWFSDVSEYCAGERVGVIERVDPRRSVLSRRDRRRREHTLVANAEQLLAVVSVAQPALKPHLVDRYLVAAHKGGLEPILCFNKVDLLAEDLAADTEELLDDKRLVRVVDAIEEFRALGYTCVLTSVVSGEGLEQVHELLRGKLTVLSGQSGVGKSSLINRIEPGLDLTVQTVSDETEKGRHTTTHAQLLPLSVGGYVVDTPGIRAFDLWAIEPGALEAYFVEFAPRVAACRFADCSHRHEADCAILAAVEAGEISVRRYQSYLKMFHEV